MKIRTKLLTELTKIITKIANGQPVTPVEAYLLAMGHDMTLASEAGEEARIDFLRRLPPWISGTTLGKIASLKQKQELQKEIAPLKDRVLSSINWVAYRNDQHVGFSFPGDSETKLFALAGIKNPENEKEAKQLIAEIKAGVFDGQFQDAIDSGRFKAWASEFGIDLLKRYFYY